MESKASGGSPGPNLCARPPVRLSRQRQGLIAGPLGFMLDIFHNIRSGGNGNGDSSAELSGPRGIRVTKDGTLYVADSRNHRVVKWLHQAATGVVVTRCKKGPRLVRFSGLGGC